jgi:hypothetical protein
MKTIQLSKGYVAQIDDEDYERVMAAGPWCAQRRPNTVYARRSIRKPDGKQTSLYLHRFLLGVTDPMIFVDHLDRDGLNCQRANMRRATRSQNAANSRNPRTPGKKRGSNFRGVSWNHGNSRWHTRIKIGGKERFLGYFMNEVHAAKAYDRAARKHFGAFASCNFPEKQAPGIMVVAPTAEFRALRHTARHLAAPETGC